MAVVAVTVHLAVSAWPGGSFLLGFATAGLWLLLGVLWLVRLGFAFGAGEGPAGVRRQWKQWAWLPVAFVLTVATASTQLPIRVGVRWAEPVMVSYARDPAASAPGWAGPYPISSVDRDGDRVAFGVQESGAKSQGGFVYSPSGTDQPCELCRHVYGPWWQDVGLD